MYFLLLHVMLLPLYRQCWVALLVYEYDYLLKNAEGFYDELNKLTSWIEGIVSLNNCFLYCQLISQKAFIVKWLNSSNPFLTAPCKINKEKNNFKLSKNLL